jgi:hypothetical protein
LVRQIVKSSFLVFTHLFYGVRLNSPQRTYHRNESPYRKRGGRGIEFRGRSRRDGGGWVVRGGGGQYHGDTGKCTKTKKEFFTI